MDDTVITDESLAVALDDPSFKWPDSPPYPAADWWKLRGAELHLSPEQVRFAAALISMGGLDKKNKRNMNGVAARAAGLDGLTPLQAHRLARSTKVRKLLNEAEETKKGKRKPLTEEEVDERIEEMITSKNDRDAATGIKLRDDRIAARNSADNRSGDPRSTLRYIASKGDKMLAAYLAQREGITDVPEITGGFGNLQIVEVAPSPASPTPTSTGNAGNGHAGNHVGH